MRLQKWQNREYLSSHSVHSFLTRSASTFCRVFDVGNLADDVLTDADDVATSTMDGQNSLTILGRYFITGDENELRPLDWKRPRVWVALTSPMSLSSCPMPS